MLFIALFSYVYFVWHGWYLRQALAAVLFFYGYLKLIEGKYFLSFLNIILALGTHASSGYPLIFLLFVRNFGIWFFMMPLLLTLIIYFFNISVLSFLSAFSQLILPKEMDVFSIYYDSEFSGSAERLAVMDYFVFVFIVYLVVIRKNLIYSSEKYKFLFVTLVSMLMVRILTYEISILGRFYLSFILSLPLLMAIEVTMIKPRFFCMTAVVVLFLIYFYRFIFVNNFNYELFFPVRVFLP